jgi:Domain of unknown function (DUF4926)
MIEPQLFDVIELLVDLPEFNLRLGARGAIVECYSDGNYEVEFSDRDGETIALCTLSANQFVVVWQAETKRWLLVSEQLAAVVDRLSEEDRKQVLNFALSLCQK